MNYATSCINVAVGGMTVLQTDNLLVLIYEFLLHIMTNILKELVIESDLGCFKKGNTDSH